VADDGAVPRVVAGGLFGAGGGTGGTWGGHGGGRTRIPTACTHTGGHKVFPATANE